MEVLSNALDRVERRGRNDTKRTPASAYLWSSEYYLCVPHPTASSADVEKVGISTVVRCFTAVFRCEVVVLCSTY